jgi:hypothetical protein
MTWARPIGAAVQAALVAAAFLTPGCGRPSDESAIRALLEDSAARAEKKDARGLIEFFAADYRDFQGRDRAGTQQLITGYFEHFRGVVIHLLGARVGDIGPDGLASVECEVSLSHGAAEVLRKLIRYAGEYYHFRIGLRRVGPGAWRFTYAEWQSIDLAELFPESLEILKKLFPGL